MWTAPDSVCHHNQLFPLRMFQNKAAYNNPYPQPIQKRMSCLGYLQRALFQYLSNCLFFGSIDPRHQYQNSIDQLVITKYYHHHLDYSCTN